MKKLALVSSLLLSISSAHAAHYTFYQDGFTGGGVVTGSFDAVDLDNNGAIFYFSSEAASSIGVNIVNEVVNFSLSFSGDSFVPGFSHTLADLDVLYFAPVPGVISIVSNFSYTEPVVGVTFRGVANAGGEVGTLLSSWTPLTFTPNLMTVSEVPVPAAAWLFGSGLIGLVASRKRKSH